MEKQDKLQWIYSSRDNKELIKRYNLWAEDYDFDLTQEIQSRGPELAGEYFIKYVDKEIKVLDAGAGTGLVGKVLAEYGFTNLVAMDLSEGMLEEAHKKNVYNELHQMVMGETLDFMTDSFGATICVGVLTIGHAPANSFDELIRVTKPGGHIVFTLNAESYENSGFKDKLSDLEKDNKWKLVEVSEKLCMMATEPDILHQIWIYEVCSQE